MGVEGGERVKGVKRGINGGISGIYRFSRAVREAWIKTMDMTKFGHMLK